MIQFQWAGSSDTGRVRSLNQDDWYGADGFFVVADGMGGHRGGEVASAVAVESMRATSEAMTEPTTGLLLNAILAANEAVLAKAADDHELRGMGTTLCAVIGIAAPDDAPDDVAGHDDWLVVANVGDSRVYLWADEELRQITQDHSLVEDLVRQGRLTEQEAAAHPQRNIVTRALGVSSDLEVDYWELPARVGDRFVLCSDGLFNEVSAEQISSVLRRLETPDDATDELVRLANLGGGRDNITVLIADVIEAEATVDKEFRRAIGDPLVRVGGVDVAGFSTALDPDVVGSTSTPSDPGDSSDELDRDRRRTPIRTLAWLLGIVAVLTVAVVAVGLFARSNFFVDIADDKVVIYQGRPGGVLWFDPTLEEISDIQVSDLTPQLLDEVERNPDYASVEGARDYIDTLVERLPENVADE